MSMSFGGSPANRRRSLSKGGGGNEAHGWEVFQKRLDMLQNSADPSSEGGSFDIEECLPNALYNKYKGREVSGNLLHYAIDIDADSYEKHKDNTHFLPDDVRLVLEAGAHVNSWMVSTAFGFEARFMPIHLAAYRGHIPAIGLLVQFQADVNQKSMHAGDPHFCPIHDAAFSQNLGAVSCLLGLDADPNLTNRDGKAAIHIASTGAPEVAVLLVEKKARLDQGFFGKNDPKTTAITLAVKARLFPKELLHILAPFCYEGYEVNFFDAMLQICKESVPYAKALIASILGQDASVNSDRRQRVVKAVTENVQAGLSPIPSLTEIIKLAPDVAAEILNIFLLTPKAAAPFHWPLPRVSNLAQEPLHTMYSPDSQWKYDSTQSQFEKQMPKWHVHLAPKPLSTEDDCEVQVKYLTFPNLLDVRVLHSLNTARDKRIFGALPIQAVVRCAWSVVSWVVHLNIACECFAIFILSWWSCVTLGALPITLAADPDQCLYLGAARNVTFFPGNFTTVDSDGLPTGLFDFEHRAVMTGMSILWALGMREAFNFCYFVGMHHTWGFPYVRLFTMRNFVEVFATSILLLFIFLYSSRGTSGLVVFLFCGNMLTRAVKLLLELALAQGVGEQILPIVSSLRPMSRFFLMAAVVYFTFLAAFSSLRRTTEEGGEGIYHISEALFFAMWAADGNSFTGLLDLDGGGYLSLGLLNLAIIFFTVCMLNLMIAIFSKVYKDNVADATLLFLQHRSTTIEQCLLRPVWRFECRWLQDIVTNTGLDHHDDDEEDNNGAPRKSRDLAPYIMSAVCFMLWLVLDVFTRPGCSNFLISTILAAAFILLQSALMQNLWFNRDYYKHRRLVMAEEALIDDATDSSGAANRTLLPGGSSREMHLQIPSVTAANFRALSVDDVEYEEDYFIWICHKDPFENALFISKRDELRSDLLKLASSLDKLTSYVTDVDEKLLRLGERFEDAFPKKRLSGRASDTAKARLNRQGTAVESHRHTTVEQESPPSTPFRGPSPRSKAGHWLPDVPEVCTPALRNLAPHTQAHSWTGALPEPPPRRQGAKSASPAPPAKTEADHRSASTGRQKKKPC